MCDLSTASPGPLGALCAQEEKLNPSFFGKPRLSPSLLWAAAGASMLRPLTRTSSHFLGWCNLNPNLEGNRVLRCRNAVLPEESLLHMALGDASFLEPPCPAAPPTREALLCLHLIRNLLCKDRLRPGECTPPLLYFYLS